MNIDLNIFISVYNVKKYIHPCIECIIKQGLDRNVLRLLYWQNLTSERRFKLI